MKNVWLQLFVITALFASVVFLLPRILDSVGIGVARENRPPKRYREALAEGVRIGQRGVYGIDLVTCGKCSVEKIRRGPFTFGAMNRLRLVDLQVVIPPNGNCHGGDTAIADVDAADGKDVRADEIADRFGIGLSFLNSRGVKKRFSALEIDGLMVSRLEGDAVVHIFSAVRGVAKSDGLHIERCAIINGGSTNVVSKALLRVKPRLRLEWQDGSLDI